MELIGYVHVKSVAWWRPVKKKAVLSALLASPLSHSHAHSASDVPRPATYKVKVKRCLKRAMRGEPQPGKVHCVPPGE